MERFQAVPFTFKRIMMYKLLVDKLCSMRSLSVREQGNKNYNILFPCTIICQTREHNKPDFYVT